MTRRKSAAVLLLLVTLVCMLVNFTQAQSAREWVSEFLWLKQTNPTFNDAAAVTGALQFTDGRSNGYMEAEIEFTDEGGDYVRAVVEIGLSINRNTNRFDVFVWLWEEYNNNLWGKFQYGFDHDLDNRYHRLTFRVEREDANTIDIRIWDCDMENVLVFHEDVTVGHFGKGTGFIMEVDHAHEYWHADFDTIGIVEYNYVYRLSTDDWYAAEEVWQTTAWYPRNNVHLRGTFSWAEPQGCTATLMPPRPDQPLYSGQEVQFYAPELDLKLQPGYPVEGGSRLRDTKSAVNLLSLPPGNWAHALFWHESSPPTPTPTNTPQPTPTPSPPTVWVAISPYVGYDAYYTWADAEPVPPYALVFMLTKIESTAAACFNEANWIPVGIQEDETLHWWLWSTSGQSPPTAGQYGCVRGCILVGWPPIEICHKNYMLAQ